MVSGFIPVPGDDASSRDLGPIQQRLLLYGFAWLQVDPFVKDLTPWVQMKGLQLLVVGSEQAHWQELLPETEPYSEYSANPIICPSLIALKRIRSSQPNRPLIYIQTAYEKPAGPRALAALVGDRPVLARRLHPSDPFRALRLFRPLDERQQHNQHLARQQFPQHPLANFMQHAVRVDPHSRFWPQEDGRVLQQRNLFHGGKRIPDFLEGTLPEYDSLFLFQMEELAQGAYILAGDRDNLDWFRADCIRLLHKGFTCWDWPQQNDVSDPSIPLILVQDSLIQFAQLDRQLPLIHLDGTTRHFHYRSLRQRPARPISWNPEKAGDRIAHQTCYGYRLSFSHHPDGWFSADGQTIGQDGEHHFAHYLETLAELGV